MLGTDLQQKYWVQPSLCSFKYRYAWHKHGFIYNGADTMEHLVFFCHHSPCFREMNKWVYIGPWLKCLARDLSGLNILHCSQSSRLFQGTIGSDHICFEKWFTLSILNRYVLPQITQDFTLNDVWQLRTNLPNNEYVSEWTMRKLGLSIKRLHCEINWTVQSLFIFMIYSFSFYGKTVLKITDLL